MSMKFRLGDFVRFVDEKIEGNITRIINEDMVGVTDADGFEIPSHVSKLTKIHGNHLFLEEDVETPSTLSPPNILAASRPGIYLMLREDSVKKNNPEFILYNGNLYQLLVSVHAEKSGKYQALFSGSIQPGQSIEIYRSPSNDPTSWPKFNLRILPHQVDLLAPFLERKKRFTPQDLMKKVESLTGNHAKAWVFRLDEDEILIDPEKLKESFFKAPQNIPFLEIPASEIDLHIEKISEDYQNLSSGQIFEIQCQHFSKKLEAAIVHKMQSIIFIHGAGTGELRRQIQKILCDYPQVKSFKEAQKEKYGNGAIEILFK